MSSLSHYEVMERQVQTLYRHDAHGRMLEVNESDAPPAPRVFLGRTAAGNLWRFRHDLPAALTVELDGLLHTEPVVSDLTTPPSTLDQLRAVLDRDAPVEHIWQGPAWFVPEQVSAPNQVAVEPLTDTSVLETHFQGMSQWIADCLPCMLVIENGDAVAVCFSSRTSTVAAEAGVETVAEFRGRGYAVAVVAAWASAVRVTGRLPLYSTSWDNVASQGVARRLGLELYGSDLHLT